MGAVTLDNATRASLNVHVLKLAGAQRADYALWAPSTPLRPGPGALPETGPRSATPESAPGTPNPAVRAPLSGPEPPKSDPGRRYANDGSIAGTNLSPISDWSPEWAFLDCFKTSRAWLSGTVDTFQDSRTLALDANGWVTSLQPGQYAKTLLFWGQEGTFPSGEYTVLYEGTGQLAYSGAEKVSGAPGRDVVRVDSAKGGWQLWITETKPADPLRNIRVIMPGGGSPSEPHSWWPDAASCPHGDFAPFEKTYEKLIFHPAFLKTVRDYKVLRFMDWMSTNNSTQQDWGDRPTPQQARWTTQGVPVEILCALANTLHADPWFCLPHKATDDYLRQFAGVVRDRLAPDLRAHVEYSNEVWNGAFKQSLYAQEQGTALHLDADPAAARACFTARRSVELFGIFSEVLGGTQRLKRVLATQAAGWFLGEVQLKHNKAHEQADLLAIAPYFGIEYGSPENQGATQAMTADQLFAALEGTALPLVYSWVDANAALARKYGLELVAYEGGQSLHGYLGAENNDKLSALFDAVNRDPRMGRVYRDYLNAWKSRGGGMFVHYLNCLNYTKWGRWGSLEHLNQAPADAPKYGALQQYIEDNR